MSVVRFVTCLLLLFVLACNKKQPGPLPFDASQLVPLLVDLQLAESLLIEIPVPLRDSMQTVYEDRLLAEHGFLKADFDSLMWLVRSEPLWIVEVFTALSDSLAIREAGAGRQPAIYAPKED